VGEHKVLRTDWNSVAPAGLRPDAVDERERLFRDDPGARDEVPPEGAIGE
jgi:hypothetical protein